MATTPEPLDHAVEQLTREPILGPRQAELVDTMIARLKSYPLSQFDLAAYQNTATFLGLIPRRGGFAFEGEEQ